MTTHYYGEIVARISGQLFLLRAEDFQNLGKKDETLEDLICDISATAARVFDTIEDLSGEHFIDWQGALEDFAISLRHFVKDGKMPTMVDYISLTALSLSKVRANQIQKAS